MLFVLRDSAAWIQRFAIAPELVQANLPIGWFLTIPVSDWFSVIGFQ
ncbi:MAG: hypothetical protein MUF72_05120 [Elainella sp. Prado103]|nr:hypothetical protein [Elainella sp. Prado103]